jgi:release factor glutamine methyltransferase
MTPRLKEALQEGIRALHVADIASPENDTTVLLAHQLQISVNDLRTKLAIDPETILSTEDYKGFQEYISRRAEHEPLQWIIGYAWFDGHQFMVGPGVFIPRPESEVMLDYILNHTAKFLEPECSFGHDSSLQPKTRILDLCAGSGSIGISALIRLLNRGEILTRLTLVEKSTEAYEYLDKNRDLQIKHPGAYTTAVLGDATT